MSFPDRPSQSMITGWGPLSVPGWFRLFPITPVTKQCREESLKLWCILLPHADTWFAGSEEPSQGAQMCPGNHKCFTGFERVKTSTYGSICLSKWPGDPDSHQLPLLVRALVVCRETALSPTTALPKPASSSAAAPSILRQTCRFAQLRSHSFLLQVPISSLSPAPGRPQLAQRAVAKLSWVMVTAQDMPVLSRGTF